MKWIEQKRQYRRYRERVERLPGGHRTAAEGLERYLLYFGPSGDARSMQQMLDDLADLFEQAAADGTSVRAVVGDEPVGFAEQFLRNYPGGSWVAKERDLLTGTLDRAAGEDA